MDFLQETYLLEYQLLPPHACYLSLILLYRIKILERGIEKFIFAHAIENVVF